MLLESLFYTVLTLLQMTLVSITFSGYIVGDAVFIAGSVMEKQGGSTLYIRTAILFLVVACLYMTRGP